MPTQQPRCACPRTDARDCAEFRYRRPFNFTDSNYQPGDIAPCECGCHDPDPDEDHDFDPADW